MSKFTDATVVTLKAYFETDDYPTEAQFAEWLDKIQQGIEEHDHLGVGDGDAAKIDHGTGLSGLTDDDHTQYLLADGARAISGAQKFEGGQDIQEESADLAAPSAGYLRVFGRDSGAIFVKDNAGNVYALALAGGQVVTMPVPPMAITLTKAGAATDSDTDADGSLVVDKTNGRIYFRHSSGTWHYVARVIDQAEMNLTTAADATKEAVRQDEFSQEHANDGTHGAITATSITNTGPHDYQEEAADPDSPGAGYRRIFARDSGGLFAKGNDGNVYAMAWSGGDVLGLTDEPRPASWQHKDAATGSQYGDLRIEWGRDTLAAGTKAITFQQAFKTLLEVFVQDKTAANAACPSAPGTTGFTCNGNGNDTFCWLAIGID